MAAAQGGQGMNNLTTLIKRLEAATSRLEDIAASSHAPDAQSTSSHPAPSPNAAVATSSSAPDLTSAGSKDATSSAPAASKAADTPPTVAAYDESIEPEVEKFLEASKGIDNLVEEQASAVAKAFADQRRFLLTTTRAKKPDLQSPA
ncbi:hypothetical protein KC348_g12309, partial [Hortaea werneckii]